MATHRTPTHRAEHVVWSRDRRAVDAHFAALTDEDLRLRFGSRIRRDVVAGYVDELERTDATAFAVFEADGRLAAFAHCGIARQTLELGLSVRPDCRRRGYATVLLRRARVYARTHGLRSLEMHSLAENVAIRELAHRHHMSVETVDGETDSRIRLRDARLGDYWRDFVLDRAGAVHGIVRRFSRVAAEG